MEANHYKFPGTPNFAVPSSYPLPHATLCPTFRPTLAVERPISQTRAGGYISPETSPTTPQHHSHGYGNPPPHLRPPISYPRRACEGQTLYRHPGMFHPGQDGTSRYESGFMPMQKQRKPKARKKTEGKQPTFLTKLYE